MEHIKFSVAISIYKNDKSKYFKRAMDSITIEQTVSPSEVILVVDGPVSGKLAETIKYYEDEITYLKVVHLEKNVGLGEALRVAVEHCSYEWIARMDADDISLPTRFEQQLSYIRHHPEISIVGGDITEFINREENIVGRRCVPQKDFEIREYMKRRCALNHMSVMYRKEAVLAAGGYLSWYHNEDYYLWIRMWLQGAIFGNTGTVLVNVRVGDEMYRRRGGRRYYESEKALQLYMIIHKMIDRRLYVCNICKRWIVQVLLPNQIRGWVFQKFARK
ncbi:MAG: glycosyltransferase [Lachnospiraceae bacterium]|nr:glycosyltransferase [Lachnospiraceae bacterium]